MSFIGRLKGRSGKVAYGFGNLGVALVFHTIGAYLIYFYVNEVGLDPTLVGIGFSVAYGVWNSINDPIAGYISDRTKSSWGRRIPYILFGTPLMVVFFILIWLPPIRSIPLSDPRNIGLFLYFTIIITIFELIYTFVTVGWNSLYPEMFQDLRERTEVSLYRQVAAMIGLIIGFVVAPQIIGFLTKEFGKLTGWLLTATLISLISGGVFLISLLGSREKEEFSMAGTLPMVSAFKVTLTNRSFLTAAFGILTTSWIWSLLSAISPFFVQYMLGGTIADVTLISAPFLLVAVIFYPLWRKICIRFGTKTTLIISTTLTTIFFIALMMIAKNIIEAAILMCFCGFANSGVSLTREILMPDVIDEDELKTGFRREGVYLGVTTFIDRFALCLTGLSTTLIFTLTGFTPGIPQPPNVIFNMRFVTSTIFATALAAFLSSMKYYPLGAERVREIRRELEKIRAEKGIL